MRVGVDHSYQPLMSNPLNFSVGKFCKNHVIPAVSAACTSALAASQIQSRMVWCSNLMNIGGRMRRRLHPAALPAPVSPSCPEGCVEAVDSRQADDGEIGGVQVTAVAALRQIDREAARR